MRQNALNFVVFLLLAGVIASLWWFADRNGFLKQDQPKKDPAAVAAEKQKKDENAKAKTPDKAGQSAKPTPEATAAVTGMAPLVATATPAPQPKAEVKPPPVVPAEPPTFLALGGTGYNIQSLLTTRGGGVQQVILTGFHEADRLGREVMENGKPEPLYLIPGVRLQRAKQLKTEFIPPSLSPGRVNDPLTLARLAEPSYTLFHYPSADDKYPDPLLGTTSWKVVQESRPDGGEHKVVFEAELPDPYFMKIRKTYTLGPKDYHIGLRVEFTRTGGQKGKGQIRFQISGPRGLPVEGEWYTSTTRIAEIGWDNKLGGNERQYEDAATIGMKRGGESVPSLNGENTFRYAAIATQYFASALAVDSTEGTAKNPWAHVRATSELPFLLSPEEIKKLEEEVKDNPGNMAALAQLARVRENRDRTLPELDDITVRAVTEPLDLAPGETLTQGYAIYNGPTKVRLLKLLQGDRAVDPGLVDRYLDTFGLKTLTDHQSPTAIGWFANKIYWTDLVIVFTNLMHGLLWAIHSVVQSWGLSIILLTVMVRLLLFFPSRKQTQMNLRMMEVQKKLKPELDKLHERYKDDFQTYNREKTKLMMQHGMNPFAAMGGCVLLFAQMPIFMGLYFCLQESIFFRLEPFLWFDNLAAPDMTVWWGEGVPLISDPDNRHGGLSFLYLGPFLNILPLISVSLMLYQQHKMMPPPTDEQTAAQQRMMKIMMGVMAVMFYKVAAGLALYFTVSTLWGIIERQLIPKPSAKPEDNTGTPATKLPKGGSPNGHDVPDKPKGLVGRFRARLQARLEELQKQAAEQSSRQVKNNPNRPEPIRNPDRRDKKKKRK
jgi:YidC/Oxa1 family membrane protein insertase